MFPVSEIMTKNVITAERETPILDAILLLLDHGITGIPIVDKERNLVGILSEFDVLRLLLDCPDNQNLKVNDFMTKNVIAFEDSVTAVDVCEFFLNNPSKRRVPIVKTGKLVGLVSRRDIVKLIAKLRKLKGHSA